MGNRARMNLVGAFAAAGGFAAAALFLGRAGAEGIPSAPALYYAGTLIENGAPVTGVKSIGLALFTTESGGSPVCRKVESTVAVQAGKFRIPLSDECLNAVRGNPNLWAETTVGTVVMQARKKIGAVPYAVEAERAGAARSATGELERKIMTLEARLATLESRALVGRLAGLWSVAPLDTCVTATSRDWVDVPNTAVTFTLDREARVLAAYSINVQPDSVPNNSFVATRLVIDGTPSASSGSHFQPFAGGDANVNLNGNHVGDLAAGSHTVTLQWKLAGPAPAWSNCPTGWNDTLAGRNVVVQAFYK